MSRRLGREEITSLLEDLSTELRRRGARADVFLVGGAAMALGYDERRSTRDLDAAFAPTDVVRAAVAAVAAARGDLAEDWLNDAVKGYLHGPDESAAPFFESDTLRVDVASAEYLLAMKLFSSRPESDADDIATLYRHLGFTTVEEGLALVETAYAPRPVAPKVQYLLNEVVAALRA